MLTQLVRGGIVVGMKVESTASGKSLVHYVISNPNSGETYTDAPIGLSFTGRFGVVADNGDGTTALYLGEGSSSSYRGNSLTAVGGTSTQAEARFTPGIAPSITANAPVTTTAAAAPKVTQISRSVNGVVSLTATGSLGVPYTLWCRTNLATGTWTLLDSGTVTGSPFVMQDASAAGLPTRFYQLSTP